MHIRHPGTGGQEWVVTGRYGTMARDRHNDGRYSPWNRNIRTARSMGLKLLNTAINSVEAARVPGYKKAVYWLTGHEVRIQL